MGKNNRCSFSDFRQIPDGSYLVVIAGRTTKSRLIKTFFQSLLAGGSTYGLDCADYWVLVFDNQGLLGAFLTGGIYEATQDYFRDVSANLRSFRKEVLQEKYFYDSREKVARKNRQAMDLNWLECDLIEPAEM